MNNDDEPPKFHKEYKKSKREQLIEEHTLFENQFQGHAYYAVMGFKFMFIEETTTGKMGFLCTILIGMHKKCFTYFDGDKSQANWSDYRTALEGQENGFRVLEKKLLPDTPRLLAWEKMIWNFDHAFYQHYLRNKETNGLANHPY